MDKSILKKIEALRSKIPENGATEEEAMAALELAGKLMDKHGITEEDLKRIDFERDMKLSHFEQKQKQEHPAQKYCDVMISKYCGTKCWSQRKTKNTAIFGLEGDVAMHEFLLGMIHDSMNRGWKEFLSQNPKEEGVSRHTQYWSFMLGFSERVNDKLRFMIDTRDLYKKSNGTDLVEAKNALIEDGLSTMFPTMIFRKIHNKSIKADLNALSQGMNAGDRVSLERPVQQAQSGFKKLN